jgi:prophage antirepressor-like protein
MQKKTKEQIKFIRANLFGKRQYRVTGITTAGIFWYCSDEVCSALGIEDWYKATYQLDEEDRLRLPHYDENGDFTPNKIFVSEAGVFELAFQGATPEAIAYRRSISERLLYDLGPSDPYFLEDGENAAAWPL